MVNEVAGLFRISSFVLRHFLVHIALVAFIALELFNVFVGLFEAFTAMFLHNFAQCGIDILGHAARVAAHEEVRTFRVEPLPNLGGVVPHPVLHVNFLGLIP